MAAASYTTDLIDWILDSDTAAWTELTNATAGGAPDEIDTESALQGTNSCSQISNITGTALASLIRLRTAITLAANEVFLMWHGHGVATALESYANGGLRVAVASSVGNWKAWAVGGNDVPPFPYAKWVNTPVDPTYPQDYENGTPPSGATNIAGVGSMCRQTQGVQRGQPHIVDIIRYGRAESRFSGGDLANGYATFAGFATQNDDRLNRWGLIQNVSGGYQWKGLMVLGHLSPVDFRDSNTSVFVQDCRKVYSSFNRIEIRQAGSRVDWTNVSFVNVSPTTNTSKGDLEVIDNCDVNLDSCTFTDLGTFVWQSNTTILDSTFRRCGQITLGGATITGSLITRSAAAVALLAGSDLSTISTTTFISSGTGHAIEITGGTTHTLNKITFTGYPVGSAGTNVTTTSTGNEAVFVNVGSGTVTLNITGGTIPSVRSSGAQVDVVSTANVTLTGLQAGSEVRAYVGTDPATSVEIAGTESSSTTFTFGQSFSGQQGYITIIAFGYNAVYLPITYGSLDVEIPIQQTVDRVYSNPGA